MARETASETNIVGAKLPRKRSSTRYWRIMKGRLCARFQYTDESGRRREKLKSITDKRTARSVFEEMRRELSERGEESLVNDQITFAEFAPLYREARMSPAVFANKVKVSGRKSNVEWAYDALIEYFGIRKLRSIKPRDLELFKAHRLNTNTRHGKKRNIATVNRELSVLRAMLTYAYQNVWIIQGPFSKIKGLLRPRLRLREIASLHLRRRLDFSQSVSVAGYTCCRSLSVPSTLQCEAARS